MAYMAYAAVMCKLVYAVRAFLPVKNEELQSFLQKWFNFKAFIEVLKQKSLRGVGWNYKQNLKYHDIHTG